MKLVFAPILMLLFFAQSFNQLLVVLEYQLNADYIAKNLCVNKAKPKLHCNGKCQMAKKLAEEEKQNTTTEKLNKPVTQVLFSSEAKQPFIVSFAEDVHHFNPSYLIAKYTEPVFPFFHPPS